MSTVHASRGSLEPASPELRSEAAIVSGIAQATIGGDTKVDWAALGADYRAVRQLIEETVPGFSNFSERAKTNGGFTLRNTARELDFAGIGGKAHFTVIPRPKLSLPPEQLLLFTIRPHDQFNTTVYDVNDRYRGVFGHRHVVLMNTDDMVVRRLVSGSRVRLTSHFRGETRQVAGFVVVPYDLPRGSAAAYFPEANGLVPTEHFAAKSRTPASKSIPITVQTE